MDYARNLLEEDLGRLQNDKESLEKMKEKLGNMPKSSIEEGARVVISEFLDNFDYDIMRIEAKMASISNILEILDNYDKPIMCRSDIWGYGYVCVAEFTDREFASNYIQGIRTAAGGILTPVLCKRVDAFDSKSKSASQIYKIFVLASDFNRFSAEIRNLNSKFGLEMG